MTTLEGLDPSWIHDVTISLAGTSDGTRGTVGVLDRGPARPIGTVVCVHGNPTWSYLWRHLLRTLGETRRVVAFDHLGMGRSQRTDRPRRLAERVLDMEAIVDAVGIKGPVTLVAHDWGGPIAMGWARRHPERVERIVLGNTGFVLPPSGVPVAIRTANTASLRDLVCARTSVFLRTALLTARLSAAERRSYRSVYPDPPSRRAIAEFVADIPVGPEHPSYATLTEIAEFVAGIEVPTLLVWGGRDFVFHDGVLADLERTLPHADVVRLASAGHLVMEDPMATEAIDAWLRSTDVAAAGPAGDRVALPARDAAVAAGRRTIDHAIRERATATPDAIALVTCADGTACSWRQLDEQIEHIARGFLARGAKPGDRVMLLAPFSIATIAGVYACLRAGFVPVVADRALGIRGLSRVGRESHPRWALTNDRTRRAAAVLRLAPGATTVTLAELEAAGRTRPDLEIPTPAEDAPAIVFSTSGATGPAKGVCYTHRQIEAVSPAICAAYSITPDVSIVVGFVTFALYAPAWGVSAAIPDVDVTRPGNLTADQLDAARREVDARMAFLAPAALRNVVQTATGPIPGVQLLLSAGAPVPERLARAAGQVFPEARVCTPYGMTEMLIVTAGIEPWDDLEGREPDGVPVGSPVEGCEVRIVALDGEPGTTPGALPPGTTGEIVVGGQWLSEGYDQAWLRNHAARFVDGHRWHRTGDVGYLDDRGRLFVQGRAMDVISTAAGPVTPVGIEQRVEQALDGPRVAVVGIGEPGVQALVVVVEEPKTRGGLSDSATAATVRAALAGPSGSASGSAPGSGGALEVAAVCRHPGFPVDGRHQSKIDRGALARWATRMLGGAS